MLWRSRVPIGLLLGCLVSITTTRPGSPAGRAPLWVTAYYAGYHQGPAQNLLPPDALDYSAVTHLIHFCLVPTAEGGIDPNANGLTPEKATAIVDSAHRHHVKVLVGVGGENTRDAFSKATSEQNLDGFVSHLVGFMDRFQYDGIDVDWEPLRPEDAARFQALIGRLRALFDPRTPRPLLTVAADMHPELLAPVQGKIDQINLMAYNLAGPYPGWVTWHNAGLFDGGFRFPGTRERIPSVDGMVHEFLSHQIAPGKLGLGIDFFGRVWTGGAAASAPGPTEPRAGWPAGLPPRMFEKPYAQIVADDYTRESYRWDAAAEAPYLHLERPNPHDNAFVSYENAASIHRKVSYVRKYGLGGVMLFELWGGWQPSAAPPDPLLQAVQSAVFGP